MLSDINNILMVCNLKIKCRWKFVREEIFGEHDIRENMPEILEILLIDRTTSTVKKTRNIIWANENYIRYDRDSYSPTSQIYPCLVSGSMRKIIKPRALKSRELQIARTKSKAEVFTPTWMVKIQNDEIDKNYENDDLETYINRTWLEITCGEGPYMATRYDMETGEIVDMADRTGFVDRKLRRINKEIDNQAEWQRVVNDAYKSCYGFEWNGDSLLLARENLLYTYCDYFVEKWGTYPPYGCIKEIAEIISYNVFQMDGKKFIIPLSEVIERKQVYQMALFKDMEEKEQWEIKPGKPVKIMNWNKNKMERFDKGVE